MSIEDRNLTPGTVLVKRYKKRDYRCEVVKGKDGKLAYKVGGKEYTSPSGAGSAVMGGTACNGWQWWSVERPEKPKATKTAKRRVETKATTRVTAAKRPARKAKRTKAGANGEEPALSRS